MKLIYLANTGVPSRAANSFHVMKMCQAFAKNGHTVTLVLPARRDVESGVDDPFAFCGVDHVFTLVKLWVPPVYGPGHFHGLRAARYARRQKPDLVYGRDPSGIPFAALLGLPVVMEFHKPLDNYGTTTRLLYRLVRCRSNFCRLVVNCGALKAYWAERDPTVTDRLVAAHNGADAPLAGVEPLALPGAAGRLQVGLIGHLYQGRGVEIVEAMARTCPWADFHLVGGTESDCAYWRERLCALGNITLHGFLPPSQLDRYRSAFDVLLAPYQAEICAYGATRAKPARFVSPIKVFEYLAAGKAILCSDLHTIREVLTDGQDALLCAPADAAAWVQALTRLRDEPELRMRLGATARELFHRKYTWTARAAAVLAGLGP